MKVFVIEAYGGKQTTDGSIAHFTVCAESVDDAVAIVRQSNRGLRYDRFDVIEETAELRSDEPGIIAEGEGSYHADH